MLDATDDNFGAGLFVDSNSCLARRCTISGIVNCTDICARETAALRTILSIRKQRSRGTGAYLYRLCVSTRSRAGW